MNNENSNSKLKMQDIINELANIKKYNNDLFSNIKGEKLEDYLNALNKSVVKAQDMAETFYTKNLE